MNEAIKQEIDRILSEYRARKAVTAPEKSLLPDDIQDGKLYEAWVMCDVLEKLREHEGYDIVLRESKKVVLKTGGGPINPAFSHFTATARGRQSLAIWTDIFFLTLSHHRRGAPGSPLDGDYHELDVVVVPAGTTGRPRHDEILIGVECKHVGGYDKELLRGILGVRRELSYLQDPQPTVFRRWPQPAVRANPPSCLLVYASSSSVTKYGTTGEIFSIDFIHRPLP